MHLPLIRCCDSANFSSPTSTWSKPCGLCTGRSHGAMNCALVFSSTFGTRTCRENRCGMPTAWSHAMITSTTSGLDRPSGHSYRSPCYRTMCVLLYLGRWWGTTKVPPGPAASLAVFMPMANHNLLLPPTRLNGWVGLILGRSAIFQASGCCVRSLLSLAKCSRWVTRQQMFTFAQL